MKAVPFVSFGEGCIGKPPVAAVVSASAVLGSRPLVHHPGFLASSSSRQGDVTQHPYAGIILHLAPW